MNTMPQLKQSPAGEQREQKIALAAAVLIHAVVLLAFAFISIGTPYELPEWVEMEFVSTSRPAQARPAPRPQPVKPAVKTEKESARKRIVLPKRRMLEEEQPVLRNRRSEKITVDASRPELLQQNRPDPGRRELDALAAGRGQAEKRPAVADDLDFGGKDIRAAAPDLGKGVQVPFRIEGEAASRTVIHRVLPEFPPGLQQEAVVKIRFILLPGGVVANARPVLKGDAALEKAALDAFRQWQFSALPPDAEQKIQQGVITFRFILR